VAAPFGPGGYVQKAGTSKTAFVNSRSFSGLRDVAEQDALYAKKNGPGHSRDQTRAV